MRLTRTAAAASRLVLLLLAFTAAARADGGIGLPDPMHPTIVPMHEDCPSSSECPQPSATDEEATAATPPAPPAQPAGDEFKRWGLSLHAGVSIPHPDFSDLRRPGPNFGVDLEYRFNKYFSLEGVYTYHRFGGETFGPFVPGGPTFELDPLNLHQLSVNGKIYAAGTSPVRPFFNLGGGAYFFSPGSTTRGGVNVGGGLQFDVTETMAVEGAYNFHNVFGFSDVKFSTVQGGVRFRF